MSHIFEFDSRIMTDKDIGLLAALEERFPNEITVTDKVVAVCKTPRLTRIILEALNANPDDQETEQEQLTYVLSPDSFKHAREEIAELSQPSNEQPQESIGSDPLCAHCKQPFQPKRAHQKYCSRLCQKIASNRRRYNKKTIPSTEPAPSAIWLDQSSGEILDIREINARLRAGRYKPGKKFRRGDSRMYIVEQHVRPNGSTEFRLKQVYT